MARTSGFLRRPGVSLTHRRLSGHVFRVAPVALLPVVSLLNMSPVATVRGLNVYASDLLFVLALCAALGSSLLHGRISRFVLLGVLLVASAFLMNAFVLALRGVDLDGWATLVRNVQVMLWGVIAAHEIRDERRVRQFVVGSMVAGVFLSCWSLWLFLSRPNLQQIAAYFSYAGAEGWGRQASYNEIGAFLVLSALMTLILSTTVKHGVNRYLLLIAVVLQCGGALLTQSRSSFLALVVGLLYLLRAPIRELGRRRVLRRAGAVVLCSIVAVAATSAVNSVNRIKLSVVLGSSANVSALTRFSTWRAGLVAWTSDLAHFLLGYGAGQTATAMGSPTTESFLIDRLVTLGLLGTVCSVWYLARPFALAVKDRRWSAEVSWARNVVVTAGIIALCVSLTGNVLMDPFFGSVCLCALNSHIWEHSVRMPAENHA